MIYQDVLNQNVINLPSNIEAGTKILVRNYLNQVWTSARYVGEYKGLVYVLNGNNKFVADGYQQAKMPKTSWNKIPLGSKALCWDNNINEAKEQYYVALLDGVPFFSRHKKEQFLEFNTIGVDIVLHTWKHAELIEEANGSENIE